MKISLSGVSSISSGEDSNIERVKVLILGSGPAGLAAALYAARADTNPVVLAGMEIGGQVSLTYTVENYPGFPDGIGGQELVELFQKQAEKFGARINFDLATEVNFQERPFVIKAYSKTYQADTVIIATGATPNHLNVPGEKEFTGKGVSYCATCDGWFFKDKDVIVVGGGDSAMEESIFLTRYAKSVTVVHRRDTLRAGAILQKRAMENPKISFIYNTVVTEILGDEVVKQVRLKNVQSGEEWLRDVDGVFIFIGHSPNTQLFKGQLDMDAANYLVVNHLMHTSVPGVFAAGEAADPHFRQVITSAGMGAAAAMQAVHYLQEHPVETVSVR
ncbi:MAG: thioredoxin-disulfide reductase [Anaerolineales bacterium]